MISEAKRGGQNTVARNVGEASAVIASIAPTQVGDPASRSDGPFAMRIRRLGLSRMAERFVNAMIVSYGETQLRGSAGRLGNGIIVVEDNKLPSMDTPSLWGQPALDGVDVSGGGNMARGPKNRVRGYQVTLAKTGVLSDRDVQFSVRNGVRGGGGEIRGGGSGVIRGKIGPWAGFQGKFDVSEGFSGLARRISDLLEVL